MYGFTISSIKKHTNEKPKQGKAFLYDEMDVGKYTTSRKTRMKFLNDKVFFQDDECAVITDGVLLNKAALFEELNGKALYSLLKENGSSALTQFRGPYSGAVYDKIEDEWLIWTNQTGESSVFYYDSDEATIIASSPDSILAIARENGLPITLNEDAIVALLTYGFMYDDLTPALEVKRLLGGGVLSIKKGKLQLNKYYDLPWDKFDLSDWTEGQIIDEVNKRFIAAVKLEYDKDCEYGYSHLSDMSGGLDCRMATWVARQCGYDGITNLHYSQSGSNEIEITTQIVNALNNELIYYPLDAHKFLYDAEKLTRLNYGLQLFSGITGGERMLENINHEKYGLEHTGMIGDAVLGTHFNEAYDKERLVFDGLYSSRNIEMLSKEHLQRYRGNPEKQFIMIRGLLGACSSAFIRRNFVEIVSPFMDVDFMEFCFSIPCEVRAHHNIYKKWILKYYPEAARIRWSTDDTKITDGRILRWLRRFYYHGPKKLARILGINKGNNNGMNPFDYWVNIDTELLQNWKKLMQISDGVCSDGLKSKIEQMFSMGNTIEKTQAISAALAVKYWMEDNPIGIE